MIMTPEQSLLYQRLVDGISWHGAYCGTSMDKIPKRGEMVIAGPCSAPLPFRIGFVVQIRLKQGDFGSHNLLIRHADGSLHQHSNNMFCPVVDEDLQLLLPFFKGQPAEEQYERGYSVGSPDSHAVGYLIAKRSDYPGSANGPTESIAVTDNQGNSEQQAIVFV